MQSNSEAVPQRAGSIRTGFARYSRQLISDPVCHCTNRGGHPRLLSTPAVHRTQPRARNAKTRKISTLYVLSLSPSKPRGQLGRPICASPADSLTRPHEHSLTRGAAAGPQCTCIMYSSFFHHAGAKNVSSEGFAIPNFTPTSFNIMLLYSYLFQRRARQNSVLRTRPAPPPCQPTADAGYVSKHKLYFLDVYALQMVNIASIPVPQPTSVRLETHRHYSSCLLRRFAAPRHRQYLLVRACRRIAGAGERAGICDGRGGTCISDHPRRPLPE